jgi:hypothetical protein
MPVKNDIEECQRRIFRKRIRVVRKPRIKQTIREQIKEIINIKYEQNTEVDCRIYNHRRKHVIAAAGGRVQVYEQRHEPVT